MPRGARRKLGRPPVECVGTLVAVQPQGHEGKTVIGIRAARRKFSGAGDHFLGFEGPAQLHEYRRQQGVAGEANARAGDGTRGQGKGLVHAPGAHQSHGLAVD
jgi:hypothetical protein